MIMLQIIMLSNTITSTKAFTCKVKKLRLPMLKITSYFDQEQSIEMHKRVKDKSVENVSGKENVSKGNTNTSLIFPF